MYGSDYFNNNGFVIEGYVFHTSDEAINFLIKKCYMSCREAKHYITELTVAFRRRTASCA